MQRLIFSAVFILASFAFAPPIFCEDKDKDPKASEAIQQYRAGVLLGFFGAQRNDVLVDITLKRFAKAKLTDAQKEAIDDIAFDFAYPIVENEMAATNLTPQQVLAQEKARQQAISDGVKGKQMEAVLANAIILTPKQKNAQAEVKKLQTQFEQKVLSVLTAEQKRLVGWAGAKIAAESVNAKLTEVDKRKVLSTLESSNEQELENVLRMLAKKSRRTDEEIARALAPLCNHNSDSLAKLADLALAKYSPSHFVDYGYRNRIELSPHDLGAKVGADTPLPTGLVVAVKAKFQSGWFSATVASVKGDDRVGLIFRGESHVEWRTRKDLYLPPDGVSHKRSSSNDVAKPIKLSSSEEPAVNTVPPVMRTWTDSAGKLKVEAKFVVLENERIVRLERKDGIKIQVPIARLSLADQRFLETQHSIAPATRSAVNLLALIDPKEHRTRGTWKWDGDVLVGSGVANIFVPYDPPREYEIKLVAERVQGKRCILLGLIAPNGKDFNAFIDAYNGSCSGIGMYDGKDVNSGDNPTAVKGQVLKDLQQTTIVYTVRQNRLKVTVGGVAIVDFQPDYDLVKRHWAWSMPRRDWLYVAINHSTFRISQMTLTPL